MNLQALLFPGRSPPAPLRRSSLAHTTLSGGAILHAIPLSSPACPTRPQPPDRLSLHTRAAPALHSLRQRAPARALGPTPLSIPLRRSYRNTEPPRARLAPHRREIQAVAIATTRDRVSPQCPLRSSARTAGNALAPAFPAAPQKFLPAASVPFFHASAGSPSRQIPSYLRTILGWSSKWRSPLPRKPATKNRPTTGPSAPVAALRPARRLRRSRSGCRRPAHCTSRLPASPHNAVLTVSCPPPTTDLSHHAQSKTHPRAEHTRFLPTALQRRSTGGSFLFHTLWFITFRGLPGPPPLAFWRALTNQSVSTGGPSGAPAYFTQAG